MGKCLSLLFISYTEKYIITPTTTTITIIYNSQFIRSLKGFTAFVPYLLNDQQVFKAPQKNLSLHQSSVVFTTQIFYISHQLHFTTNHLTFIKY